MKLTKLSKKQKRELVLQEATILFSQQGYSETTISQIAKASGVSFGSVFTYFENKEELFKTILLQPLENRLKPMFIIDPDSSLSAIAHIKIMIKEHINLFAKEGVYLRLIQYVLGQPERFPDIFFELNNFLQQAKESLGKLVIRGQIEGDLLKIDPEVVSLSYISFLNGIRLTILDGPEHKIWELYIPQALRLFGPVK